ncbi:hypothetical protein OV079_13005 [Nannocystis pusilla]|uniref:Uncharacterized protein n=1 Tax=Nannocystis pusilla TaxID=889268 RepID=A0A9X3IWI2_9BACT|nr:hypothetical protein [Nannocystis pusilla]MCY1006461.1 hypothetical protein [Nannocystis pusilla]
MVPVIIMESARMQFWEAVPFYFREFLEIFFYTVDNEKGKIWLRDGKKHFVHPGAPHVWLCDALSSLSGDWEAGTACAWSIVHPCCR